MNLGEEKAKLRQQVLARRDAIDAMTRIEYSLKAADIGAANLKTRPGMVVSGFFPIRSEIDARPLMDALRQRGVRLCLPVVLDKTTIVFRELVRGGELVPTGFGTSGPAEDAPVVDPELLIMPLSVFDRSGGRIGYGAGHYDRAIDRLVGKGITPRLEGLAFSCQEAEAVPVEKHDQPLHAVITEREYIVTGR
ncbi:5-formyltetrahydrofolate cyclo-ligase [Salaquimonas pukyongi]|uniref:5-formyltetrahydrofolate cyclo-ligase n=1 Tax=Salaquimonas pukyongi TaxID=2712698 RepID=UPI00096BAC10|nr:5-formyltetrahydrofolate cyclo-ligase [Salaquimonas pukyongi]